MTPELEQQIRAIIQDELLKSLNFRTQADRTVFQKMLQILDGKSIQFGRTNGTMIGTASDQKIGFYGATPVVQAGAISAPSGGATADTQSRTAITALIAVLKNNGITS